MAVNNIAKVQNLQRCESLRRLDLTVNFVDKAGAQRRRAGGPGPPGARRRARNARPPCLRSGRACEAAVASGRARPRESIRLEAPQDEQELPAAGLLSLASLRENAFLEELQLVGNPCTRWPGYRPYVVGLLPQLRRLVGGGGSGGRGSRADVQAPNFLPELPGEGEVQGGARGELNVRRRWHATAGPQDGEEVRPSERIAAQQQWAALHSQLRAELEAEGVDPDTAAEVGGASGRAGAAACQGIWRSSGAACRPWMGPDPPFGSVCPYMRAKCLPVTAAGRGRRPAGCGGDPRDGDAGRARRAAPALVPGDAHAGAQARGWVGSF